MDENGKLKDLIEFLEELAREGKFIDLRICPQCKSPSLQVMDVVGLYAPLSPVRCVCKRCGWVGRATIELTNRRIDEKDEDVLDDIISSLSEEREKP